MAFVSFLWTLRVVAIATALSLPLGALGALAVRANEAIAPVSPISPPHLALDPAMVQNQELQELKALAPRLRVPKSGGIHAGGITDRDASGAIAIPVIPSAPSAFPSTLPSTPLGSPADPNAQPLPVPELRVPVGNVGNRHDISPVTLAAMPWMAEPMTATVVTATVQYRVLVETPHPLVQAQVQTLVPTAFVTLEQGRPVMQVGSFEDPGRANALQQTLARYGFWARVELQRA